MWKKVLISVLISGGLSTESGGPTARGWISTGLLKENKQVFNGLMAEKYINLLILQSGGLLWTTGVNA